MYMPRLDAVTKVDRAVNIAAAKELQRQSRLSLKAELGGDEAYREHLQRAKRRQRHREATVRRRGH